MPPEIATLIWAVGVLGLFVLDRDRSGRTSPALWIPLCWVSLAASRMVSQWIGPGPETMSVDRHQDGNALDRNVLSALIAAGVLVLLGRRREVGALLRANAPILVFLFYCAMSVLWSDYPDVAFKRWTKAVGEIVMVLVVLTDPGRLGALKCFLARIGFLLVPASILLIKYYPSMGQVYINAAGKMRYTGVTMDKNMLGAICLISGLAAVWRLLDGAAGGDGPFRRGPLIAQVVLLAMVLWLFRIAGSMTSLACFLLAAGLMAAMRVPAISRRTGAVHVLVFSVLTAAFGALFLDVGAALVETMGKDATLTGRTGLWEDLLRISQHPLLGSGFESFWLGKRLEELWGLYWWHPSEAHNGYLEVFLNLGWVGVALLAVVIAAGYGRIVTTLRRDPAVARLRLGFLVAAVAYGMTEAAFRVLHPVWTSLLLAILAMPAPVSSDYEAIDVASAPPEDAAAYGSRPETVGKQFPPVPSGV